MTLICFFLRRVGRISACAPRGLFFKKVFRRLFSREMRGEGKIRARFDLRLACILMRILFLFLFFNFYGRCGAGAPPPARRLPPPSPLRPFGRDGGRAVGAVPGQPRRGLAPRSRPRSSRAGDDQHRHDRCVRAGGAPAAAVGFVFSWAGAPPGAGGRRRCRSGDTLPVSAATPPARPRVPRAPFSRAAPRRRLARAAPALAGGPRRGPWRAARQSRPRAAAMHCMQHGGRPAVGARAAGTARCGADTEACAAIRSRRPCPPGCFRLRAQLQAGRGGTAPAAAAA